jgi:hypothetical protein
MSTINPSKTAAAAHQRLLANVDEMRKDRLYFPGDVLEVAGVALALAGTPEAHQQLLDIFDDYRMSKHVNARAALDAAGVALGLVSSTSQPNSTRTLPVNLLGTP